ncbi:hypothetical protein PC117_g6745 [Phytophthora cactorum]|uniref:Uncharacterized protein n=1 Tax=Phytophthora cactorum TaxID=29920 RepID=A0A8T1E784_9STRA|nr:hypothetical protein PC117_g6745 [Phytophthora cactorum]
MPPQLRYQSSSVHAWVTTRLLDASPTGPPYQNRQNRTECFASTNTEIRRRCGFDGLAFIFVELYSDILEYCWSLVGWKTSEKLLAFNFGRVSCHDSNSTCIFQIQGCDSLLVTYKHSCVLYGRRSPMSQVYLDVHVFDFGAHAWPTL